MVKIPWQNYLFFGLQTQDENAFYHDWIFLWGLFGFGYSNINNEHHISFWLLRGWTGLIAISAPHKIGLCFRLLELDTLFEFQVDRNRKYPDPVETMKNILKTQQRENVED